MQTPAHQFGSRRQWIEPLTRRRGLRVRCARPGGRSGQLKQQTKQTPAGSGLKGWQRAARLRRTLVVVKRRDLSRPASLERGSAATRTVVRSISSAARRNELTHLSKINRR